MDSMKLSNGSKIQTETETLPCDIIFNILSRLRVKALCRLRCVSKLWRDLISSPAFIDHHHRQSERNPLLLVAFRDSSNKRPRLVSLDKRGSIVRELHVSCEAAGRYLVAVPTCRQLACVYGYKTAYVCNPAMGELIPLPENSTHDNNTLSEQWTVAFGYVPSTKEYKVVRLFLNISEDNGGVALDCEIISVRIHDNNRAISCDERWRAVEGCPFIVCCNSATVNGYIHMMPALHGETDDTCIVRFDLEREEWSVLRPPWLSGYFTWESRQHEVFLRELKGQLCVVHSSVSVWHELMHTDIWLLKDYERGEWVKQYSFDISSFRCFHQRYFTVIPLSIEEDGRLLMEIETERFKYSNHDRKSLVYYDPESRGFQTIFGDEDEFTTTFYVESFLCCSEN